MVDFYREPIFFHYILSSQIFLNNTKPEFFKNNTVKDLFVIAKEYAIKYKDAPSMDQMVELIHIKGLNEKYNDDIIETLYNVKQKLAEYDSAWLDENIGAWIQVRNLENTMVKAISYMKINKVTAENASETVEKIRHMMTTETAIDFTFNLGVDFFDAASHMQTRLARTSTGYPFIDKCLKGGWWKGSLIVFLGPPKGGKSLWLNNLAANSVKNGFNTAYVTLELQHEIVNMRIGSNMLNIPMDDYEESSKDQDLLKRKIGEFKQSSLVPLGNLHVKEFPSSTMSTNDLRAYLVKAQELLGYKFDNIFVDYLNIMKNWRNPNTENLYMKIKQITEDLRAVAQEEQWAIISATQTNRNAFGANDLVISNVSESAGLLHTVDGLFGIIADPEMKAKGEYYLKYLADRVSGMENTRKKYNLSGKYMRITEDINSPIEDMEFIVSGINSFNSTHKNNNQTQSYPSQPTTTLNNSEIKITGNSLFDLV